MNEINFTYTDPDKEPAGYIEYALSDRLHFLYIQKLYPSHSCNNLIEPEVRKLFVGVKVAIQKYIVHYQCKICETVSSFEKNFRIKKTFFISIKLHLRLHLI